MKSNKKSKMENDITSLVKRMPLYSTQTSRNVNILSKEAKSQQYLGKKKLSNNQKSPQKQDIQIGLMTNNKKETYLSSEKLSKANIPLSKYFNKNQKAVKNHSQYNPQYLLDQKNQLQKQKNLELQLSQKNIKNVKIENNFKQNPPQHQQQQKKHIFKNLESKDIKKQQNLRTEKNVSYKNLYYKKYGKKPEKKQNKQYLQLIKQSMTRYDQKLKKLGQEKPKDFQQKKKEKSMYLQWISSQQDKDSLVQVKQNKKQQIDQGEQLHIDEHQNNVIEIGKNDQQNNPKAELIHQNDQLNVVELYNNHESLQYSSQQIDEKENQDMPQLPQFEEISNILEDKQKSENINTSNYMQIFNQAKVEEIKSDNQQSIFDKIEPQPQISIAKTKYEQIRDITIQKESTISPQTINLNFKIFSHRKIQPLDIIKIKQQIKHKKPLQYAESIKSIQQKQDIIIRQKLNLIIQQPKSVEPFSNNSEFFQQSLDREKDSEDQQEYKQTIIDDNGNIIHVTHVSIRDLGYCNILIISEQSQEVSIASVN